jgi:NitT/TauT family transport system substrate-binding protein
MTKKRIAILVSIIVLVSFLAIIFWPRPPHDSNKINFRLKWLWYAGWAGELIAENDNIWNLNDLKVDVRPGGFELDPIKLVASGEDQIGVAGADQVLMARMNGVPIVAFAAQYQKSPVGFAVMKTSGIQNIADFKGKRIGVKYGTDVEPVYRTLLAKEGITKNDITEIPVKFDLLPFFSGTVDVYPGYLTNDLLLPEEMGYDVNIISAIDENVTVYGNVYFCREDYLRNNPKQLVAFLSSMEKAWHAAFSYPPEHVADIAIAKSPSLNRNHEIRVVKSLKPYVIPDGVPFGQMTDTDWKHLYSILRTQGVIDRDFDYRLAYSLDILNVLLSNSD